MAHTHRRWTTVEESAYPWEREALAYVREHLPNAEPFRAWSNFEFIADDGSINEVDLFVVSTHRIYLVEIKSWPGQIGGDAHTWTRDEAGRLRTYDSPLLLTNRKAKKLKSLLARQAPMRRQRMPYVEPVVFLSHPGVRCTLEGVARAGVYLRDELVDGAPGIAAVLQGGTDRGRDSPITAPLAAKIARAVDAAGIRPSRSQRAVGDLILGDLIAETDVFQDWRATHAQFERTVRRVRIYPNARASSETTRGERRSAAHREFRLLQGIEHPGILRALDFNTHERGPALIFEHPEPSEPLAAFLGKRLERLDLRQRLGLIRQVAETLAFAHGRHLYHQTLTPHSILVCDPESDTPTLKLMDWQAGAAQSLEETTTRLSAHMVRKLGVAGRTDADVYLAPELHTVGAADPARADAFGLGALAYHLISGNSPAATVEELSAKLRQNKGLLLSERIDGIGGDLETLVQFVTDPETSNRLDVSDFLPLLDEVIGTLAELGAASAVHPLDASAGDELEGGFVVAQRLGKGSTAVALLAERDGRRGVLKVALQPEHNDRILAEADVLRTLRHAGVVELYDTVRLGEHAALFLAVAGVGDERSGAYTLAQRIRQDGRLSLDLLQRFGEELLSVVDWLEQKGVSHRDIKPDNIGVAQTNKGKLTLVLFDFSLTGTPSDNIRAGTPPYLDPFLTTRTPPRWDAYAERFAAAVTLYEMATGQLPSWGDGQSDPAAISDEVRVDSELFDPAVRDELGRFFRKALSRRYDRRHDTAEQMRREWVRLFEVIDAPVQTDAATDHDDEAIERALAQATDQTPVASLPLTPRVLDALQRMGVTTLAELHALPRIRLFRNKGIGARPVREIRKLADAAAAHLAGRLADADAPVAMSEQDPREDPARWSLDLIAPRLISSKLTLEEQNLLGALVGTRPTSDSAPAWRSVPDVAESVGYPQDDVRSLLTLSAERWRKDRPAWSLPLRDELADVLRAHGGIMTRDEVVQALLARRGSAAPEPKRSRRAAAASYAAVLVETERTGARYGIKRGTHHVFLAATAALDDAFRAAPPDRTRYAELLGAEADRIAGLDPLLPPERALDALLTLPGIEAETPLAPERVLRLAVAASQTAALSSRLELYPRHMDAERALRLGTGSLLGPRKLTVAEAQRRVASRYPEAAPLPPRPDLDALLTDIGLPHTWDDEERAFVTPDVRSGQRLSSDTHSPTTTRGILSPLDDPAAALDRRVQLARDGRRLLVLTVGPRYHAAAVQRLQRDHGYAPLSLDALIIGAMRTTAQALGVDWQVVRAADAHEPGSRERRNLDRLVGRALDGVIDEIALRSEPTLLLHPGLLARYERIGLIERLREACRDGKTPPLILLVPADARAAMPVIDRAPIPLVHASDWARIPSAWLTAEDEGRLEAAARLGSIRKVGVAGENSQPLCAVEVDVHYVTFGCVSYGDAGQQSAAFAQPLAALRQTVSNTKSGCLLDV